jgi:hypothetical protein
MPGGVPMALPMTFVAGTLIFSGAQSSDIADGSRNDGFLSKYMLLRPESSGVFRMRKNLEPQKISDKDEDKDAQELFTNVSNKHIGLSAIGVALLSVAAMVGVRMRRGIQPPIALTSSGGHGIDMSRPMAPVSVDNTLKLKSRDFLVRSPEQVLQISERALAKDMHADIKSPFALWDPIGLGEASPEAHGENFLMSEVQHGRVAMTAVFFVSTFLQIPERVLEGLERSFASETPEGALQNLLSNPHTRTLGFKPQGIVD